MYDFLQGSNLWLPDHQSGFSNGAFDVANMYLPSFVISETYIEFNILISKNGCAIFWQMYFFVTDHWCNIRVVSCEFDKEHLPKGHIRLSFCNIVSFSFVTTDIKLTHLLYV